MFMSFEEQFMNFIFFNVMVSLRFKIQIKKTKQSIEFIQQIIAMSSSPLQCPFHQFTTSLYKSLLQYSYVKTSC